MTLNKLSDSLLEFVTSFGSFMPGLLASVLCEVELKITRTCIYLSIRSQVIAMYIATNYVYICM